MNIGVPQALKAAGLADKVKIVSQSGGAANYQYIKDGSEAADLFQDINYTGYRMADAVARAFAGQDEGADEVPLMFITPQNISSATFAADKSWTAFPDTLAQFKKIWGLS
jgi:ABC-type sugar transport system substrate-binding protein